MTSSATSPPSTARADSLPIFTLDISGPTEIALAVDAAAKKHASLKPARDSFFNELIVWRELAVNFVKYTPNYDSAECAEPWARQSLAEHAHDRREWTYTLEQLERGETHDELWNASQLQMVHFGWMHNYMRMYWGKKILEWSQRSRHGICPCGCAE